MSHDSTMKKLEELMQGLQRHYSRLTDDPSRIEMDLFKEKLRKFYDLVCEIEFGGIEKREEREVERGEAEGHPAGGGEKGEMREEGEMEDVGMQNAEQGTKNAEVVEEENSNIENRTSKIENGVTLADKFMNAADRTLAAKIKKQHIQDLKTAIGLNDKFNFIKELFNNDVLKYNETVDQLNQAGSREKAESHLATLKEKYQWADELEPYLKFSEYVDKKYF